MLYISATLKIYGKENWRNFNVYGHGMQSINSVNSTLEWSCILAISLYCHWNHSVFHRSEQFHPQFIIKPSSGPFPFLILFKSFHIGSQNVLFKKTNLIMSLPCHSPFKNFPLSSPWKLESWICFSVCFSGLISCCFPPVHVLHCIPTGLAFGLVLWLPFARFHSTYFIHEAWETCPTSSSVPPF